MPRRKMVAAGELPVQYLSDADGKTIAVIVPIKRW
jgi:hypothetical protein